VAVTYALFHRGKGSRIETIDLVGGILHTCTLFTIERDKWDANVHTEENTTQ
jgi:hypothetical protein